MAKRVDAVYFPSPKRLFQSLDLPQEFSHRVQSPIPLRVRQSKPVTGAFSIIDTGLWKLGNTSRNKIYDSFLRSERAQKRVIKGFSTALQDVLPHDTRQRRILEKIEPLGKPLKIPRNIIRTAALFPFPLGGFVYPYSPFPFPSINITTKFISSHQHHLFTLGPLTTSVPVPDMAPRTFSVGPLHKTIEFFTQSPHTFIDNPAHHFPFLITINAVAAFLGFGIPNIVRALSERKIKRAAFYAGLHGADILIPAAVSNSMYWDLPLRYRDAAVKHANLHILNHALSGPDAMPIAQKILATVNQEAVYQKGEYKTLLVQKGLTLQEAAGKQTRQFYRAKDHGNHADMEEARQDAVENTQLATTVPHLLDIIEKAREIANPKELSEVLL